MAEHRTERATALRSESLRDKTHVDFSFAHNRYAIFILHSFSSCERDAEISEHGTLRWREQIVRDKSHSSDRGMLRKVTAYCLGHSNNLNAGRMSRISAGMVD
jgi:hypothetical protein